MTAHGTDLDVIGCERRMIAAHLIRFGWGLALGMLLVAAAVWDWRWMAEFGKLRLECMVSEMVAGVGIVICFGGGIEFLDTAMRTKTARGTVMAWYWRGVLACVKRVLFVGQLGAAVMVVGVAGFVVFGKALPTGDWVTSWESYSPLPVPVKVAAPDGVVARQEEGVAGAVAGSGPATAAASAPATQP